VFLKKPKVGLPPYKGRGPRPKKVRVLPGQPQAQSVSKIAQSQKLTWKSLILAEGAKGPIVAEVARLRVLFFNSKLPKGSPLWLFMRRTPDGQVQYALSNAPKRMSMPEMCKASTLRWPIEKCFEEGKGQIGMDHYEHRSWPGWHRHMTYVFLGLHFLFCLLLRFKKTPALTLPQARRLVAAVLPLHSLNLKGAIEIVKYHTHRNFVAHRSHRKKKLAKLRSPKTKVSP
jgi:SRSO17 transposase